MKMKFERSLNRLVEHAISGDVPANESDIISPFTDQSLNRSLPTIEQPTHIPRSHSEQFLQACPDELDYGTLQRFSSDSCFIIRVPEQYTPSSTVFFDELRATQIEQKTAQQSQAATASSAFSFYTKQDYPQPSSSPLMTTITSDLIENISPIHPYTPRSLDDSSVEFGERDMADMSDEFILVKNLTPSPSNTNNEKTTSPKETKTDTPPSNSSSNSSDKHESPDIMDIIQHQLEYPPLDTGFDLRTGTTLETVYESPELRQEEIKSAISTLSLNASETNRPLSSTEHNSSNTPNTDDSLLEFERIEMELLRNSSTSNIIEIAREIRSSVDSLTQQHDADQTAKVESFLEKHFPSVETDVQHVINDILDQTSDLTHSISSQSDATTVIYKSHRQSIDDDYVQVTHDDFTQSERSIFSSDEDMMHQHARPSSSQEKRRLSAPNTEPGARRLKTPSSSSSSSSSFSSTSRSVIYSQQHSHPSTRILQAETDLASFRQPAQTQSATDLPFLPPFVSTNPTMKTKRPHVSISSTPSLVPTESLSSPSNVSQTKKKTQSHPGSLGGGASSLPPPNTTFSQEGIHSSRQTSISPHSSSSSHHSDDCYCPDSSSSTSHPH